MRVIGEAAREAVGVMRERQQRRKRQAEQSKEGSLGEKGEGEEQEEEILVGMGSLAAMSVKDVDIGEEEEGSATGDPMIVMSPDGGKHPLSMYIELKQHQFKKRGNRERVLLVLQYAGNVTFSPSWISLV